MSKGKKKSREELDEQQIIEDLDEAGEYEEFFDENKDSVETSETKDSNDDADVEAETVPEGADKADEVAEATQVEEETETETMPDEADKEAENEASGEISDTVSGDVAKVDEVSVEENETSEEASEKRGKKKKEKKPKKIRIRNNIIRTVIILAVLTGCYFFCIYSQNAFITKWRTIYIETAMTTNSHKWLATAFIPKSIIDDVMSSREKIMEEQKDITSTWGGRMDEPAPEVVEEVEEVEEIERLNLDMATLAEAGWFYKNYWELDTKSMRKYFDKHPEVLENGYGNIYINNLDKKANIKSVNDDTLVVLDVANNLMIFEVTGDSFVGKLAVLKNVEQLDVVISKNIGSRGQEAWEFGEENDALLVMNASAFYDPKGSGAGGVPKGSMIVNGVEYGANHWAWKFVGLTYDNYLYVGNYGDIPTEQLRWGAQFTPILIVDGEQLISGSYGWGLQPRTAIGQTENKDILMLIVDGRQVGYSIGCSVGDCSDILYEYKAYQAFNLDGGSSSVFWYDGQLITRPSSASGRGRYMPDALIVRKMSYFDEVEEQENTKEAAEAE